MNTTSWTSESDVVRVATRGRLPAKRKSLIGLAIVCICLMCGCGGGGGSGGSNPAPVNPPPPQEPVDVVRFSRSTETGLARRFSLDIGRAKEVRKLSGGVAAGDYDGDGDTDLVVVGGNADTNRLFRNRGDGTFDDVSESAGVDFRHWGSGPAFGDIDGDGDLDLFIGAVEGDPYYLLENQDGIFVDRTPDTGIVMTAENTISATFLDYDVDGYLDLYLTHWGVKRVWGDDTEALWRNQGDWTFVNRSSQTGLTNRDFANGVDPSFAANFADIDGDGYSDLLLTSDYATSQVFVNNGNGTFTDLTDRGVIIDQAGMGASVGDYDNDGDMDWFVTSIYSLDGDNVGEPFFGNRLYANLGNGSFEDVTLAAGVANGGWGWGSCFSDFDNDGHLDIFHVNGWSTFARIDFTIDRVRFFHSQGDGTFDERAREVGLDDLGQGRGLVCFDADRDGDIDILITNNSYNHLVFYDNRSQNDNHYLVVKLVGAGANRFGIGSRITVSTANTSYIRQLGAANNYVSHNPYEAHFGLAGAETVEVEVRWPNGAVTRLHDVAADQLLTVTSPEATSSDSRRRRR